MILLARTFKIQSMSDYFEELGHTPTGPNGPEDFDRNYRRLQVLAKMNGIDLEIKVPEASIQAIRKLPNHTVFAVEEGSECPICKEPTKIGDNFKILPCKHEFHEECILLWLKKTNSCPLCRQELETDDPVYEELRQFNLDRANRADRQQNLMDSMFS